MRALRKSIFEVLSGELTFIFWAKCQVRSCSNQTS